MHGFPSWLHQRLHPEPIPASRGIQARFFSTQRMQPESIPGGHRNPLQLPSSSCQASEELEAAGGSLVLCTPPWRLSCPCTQIGFSGIYQVSFCCHGPEAFSAGDFRILPSRFYRFGAGLGVG